MYFIVQMGGLEAVLTGLRDEFRVFIRKFKYGREAITAAVVMTAMLFALQNITNVSHYKMSLTQTTTKYN